MEQKQDGTGQGERRRGSAGAPVDIKDFLLERIAEDEEIARGAVDPSGWGSSPDGRWHLVEVPYEGEWPRNPDAEQVMWADSEWTIHASRHDPARVLAECAAKRAIIEAFDPEAPFNDPYVGHPLLSMLATVYSEHPEYQQDWAA